MIQLNELIPQLQALEALAMHVHSNAFYMLPLEECYPSGLMGPPGSDESLPLVEKVEFYILSVFSILHETLKDQEKLKPRLRRLEDLRETVANTRISGARDCSADE